MISLCKGEVEMEAGVCFGLGEGFGTGDKDGGIGKSLGWLGCVGSVKVGLDSVQLLADITQL